MTLVYIMTAIVAYLFPAILAVQQKHRNYNSIFLANLLLGWTSLGWIVSLIWASTDNVKVKNV